MKHDEPDSAISEKTPVRLGLIFTIVGILAGLLGGIGTFTWWARGLQADVQVVQRDVAGIRESLHELQKVGEIELRMRELEKYGSENAKKNAQDILDLRRDMDRHLMREEKGK